MQRDTLPKSFVVETASIHKLESDELVARIDFDTRTIEWADGYTVTLGAPTQIHEGT